MYMCIEQSVQSVDIVKQHAGDEIGHRIWIVFEQGKNCDGDDEDCKAVLIWQVVDDGGRDDCSFAVKKTEPDQLD